MAMSTMTPPTPGAGRWGSRTDADCGSESLPGELPGRRFLTPEKNPFLFPLDLLDRVSGGVDNDTSSLEDDNQKSEEVGDCRFSNWWLVHTKPRQEKRLADELRSLEVPHYLPATRCKAVTRGRSRFTLAPQFPGYLFLNGNSEHRMSALKTNRIVATHRVANPMQLYRQLWDLADLIEKGVPLRIEERLVAGQHVRVKGGLLKDKCGIVMKRGGKTRLFIYVAELLGGVSLEIEQHLLEPY